MVDLKKTLTVLTAAKAAIARPLSPSNSDIGESELSTTDDFGSESLMGQFNMTVDGDTGPSLYLQVDEDTAEELEERYDFLFKREPKGGGGGGGRGGGGKSSGGKSGGGKSGDGKSSGIGGKSKSGPDTRTGEPVKGPIPEVFTREGSSLYAGGGPYHKRSSSASKKGNSTIVVVDLTELPKGMEYGFQVSSTGSLPNQEEADKMAVLGSNVIISGTGDENSTFDRDLFVRYPNNTIQGYTLTGNMSQDIDQVNIKLRDVPEQCIEGSGISVKSLNFTGTCSENAGSVSDKASILAAVAFGLGSVIAGAVL